jgi:hypothetical protein
MAERRAVRQPRVGDQNQNKPDKVFAAENQSQNHGEQAGVGQNLARVDDCAHADKKDGHTEVAKAVQLGHSTLAFFRIAQQNPGKKSAESQGKSEPFR